MKGRTWLVGNLIAATLFWVCQSNSNEANAEWPQWRGPNRDGISAEKGLLKTWPEGGPNPENPRDRARQENATLATAEKGEALIAIHTRFVAGKMQALIDALDQQHDTGGE